MTVKKPTRITGIGSALVDILINESDDFLNQLGKEKGGMTLVDDATIKNILKQSSNQSTTVPGGAACNTIVGVGRLGGQARFIGKRGNDDDGKAFEASLVQSGVEPLLSDSDSPTGKVLSVITPDAQRSMFTFLGASTEMTPSSITADMFKDTAIAMIEGYLLFNRELMIASLKAAKNADALIALDLASFEVVNTSKDILNDLIAEYVDILIANEDEARAFTGIEDEQDAIKKMAVNVTWAILKVGGRGSFIAHKGQIFRINPQKGNPPQDTTGAGDLWAAGFLYGLAHGFSIEKCGQIGSACGYEVCQVMGAHLPEEAWGRIKALI